MTSYTRSVRCVIVAPTATGGDVEAGAEDVPMRETEAARAEAETALAAATRGRADT